MWLSRSYFTSGMSYLKRLLRHKLTRASRKVTLEITRLAGRFLGNSRIHEGLTQIVRTKAWPQPPDLYLLTYWGSR